jgi:hypothetical protein
MVFFIDPGAGGAAGTPVGGVTPGAIPSMVFIIDPGGGTDFEAGAGAAGAGAAGALARAFPHAGQ